MNEAINAGEKDYTALVSKLKDAGVDAVYFGGYHPEAGLILKQMREQGLNASMLSGDAINTDRALDHRRQGRREPDLHLRARAPQLPTAKKIVEEFKASRL